MLTVLICVDLNLSADSNFLKQFRRGDITEVLAEEEGPTNLKVRGDMIHYTGGIVAVLSAYIAWTGCSQEGWIQNQMEKHESEYIDLQTVSVCVGTWNVNGRLPKEDPTSCNDLKPWLYFANAAESPDLYVLGFQELDLSAEAFVFNDSSREDVSVGTCKSS